MITLRQKSRKSRTELLLFTLRPFSALNTNDVPSPQASNRLLRQRRQEMPPRRRSQCLQLEAPRSGVRPARRRPGEADAVQHAVLHVCAQDRPLPAGQGDSVRDILTEKLFTLQCDPSGCSQGLVATKPWGLVSFPPQHSGVFGHFDLYDISNSKFT